MPFTTPSDTRSKVFVLPGITHSPIHLKSFVSALSGQLNQSWGAYAYHDARLESKNSTNLYTSAPTPLETLARTIADEMITSAPTGQDYHIAILYSFDCYLAPLLQKIFNDRELEISFILVDQPTLEKTQAMAEENTLKKAEEILSTVANSGGYECQKINDDVLKALCDDGRPLDQRIVSLFQKIFPDFNPSSDSSHQSAAVATLLVTLANLRCIYSGKYTPENSVNLENALIISTKEVRDFYGLDEKLGWENNVKNLETLALEEVIHLHALQPGYKEVDHNVLSTIQKFILEKTQQCPETPNGECSPPTSPPPFQLPPPSPSVPTSPSRGANKRPRDAKDAKVDLTRQFEQYLNKLSNQELNTLLSQNPNSFFQPTSTRPAKRAATKVSP